MAAVRAVIEVFQNDTFQASDAACFHAILERQTDHLAHLADDLLAMSRIARGTIEPDRGMHDLSRLFQLFHRVDAAATPEEGSLGIGLYLVRQILALHDGRVEAPSEGLGLGSTFSVYLPLTSAPLAPTPNTADGAPKSGQRILLVEDNRDVADALAFLLRGKGAAVEEAYDGETALGKLTHFRPDVILLDLGMSGMSGFDVARRVRAMPAMDGVVLIAITGWGQQEDRRRTREAGFDHHLVKPTAFSELWSLLESLPGNRDDGSSSARL